MSALAHTVTVHQFVGKYTYYLSLTRSSGSRHVERPLTSSRLACTKQAWSLVYVNFTHEQKDMFVEEFAQVLQDRLGLEYRFVGRVEGCTDGERE